MTRSARDAIAEELASLLWDVDDETALANRILSRLAEEGFVVVPREPTDEMIIAGAKHDPVSTPVTGIYMSMLAAIEGKETG